MVVGGADKGGILVRTGEDTSSDALPDRLSTGAVVSEILMKTDRLQYRKLQGEGPETGWVTTSLKDKDLLVRIRKIWKVVGGGEKGGVLVREGKDTSSGLSDKRLSTGSLVREIGLEDERLCYDLIRGSGPPRGWVSVLLKDKPLLVKLQGHDSSMLSTISKLASESSKPVVGQKIRILALHGSPSNSNILKFISTPCKRAFGNEVEWIFLDSPILWEPQLGDVPPEWVTYAAERSELEERLAQGKPFQHWYKPVDLVHNFKGEFDYVDEGCNAVLECLLRERPIDVVLTFSQGGGITSALLDKLRREGAEIPWRLTVSFNGPPPPYRYWHAPSPHPAVMVFGGEEDPWTHITKPVLSGMYSNVRVIDHDDGHSFPTTQPRAAEIYGELLDEMRRHCGLPRPQAGEL